MNYRVEIITTDELFAALRKDWDDLVFGNPQGVTVFQTSAYLYNHWKHRKSGDGFSRKLRVYALYQDSILTAVAPMWITTVKKMVPVRILEFIGSRGLDYLEVISKAGASRRQACERLLEAVVADPCWDVLSLCDMRNDFAALLETTLEGLGTLFRRDKGSTCVSIPLPGTWEDYRSQIGKSTRRHLNYEENKLEKSHPITFTVHTVFDDSFLRVIKTLHSVHQQRWKAVGHQGSFNSENAKTMDIEICRELAEKGAMRYFVLSASGVPIAGMACAALGKTIYVHTMLVALESEFKNFSVGKVVLQKSIKWAIENGYANLDMLRGTEPYKFNFGGIAAGNVRITGYRNRLTSSLCQVARWLGKPV